MRCLVTGPSGGRSTFIHDVVGEGKTTACSMKDPTTGVETKIDVRWEELDLGQPAINPDCVLLLMPCWILDASIHLTWLDRIQTTYPGIPIYTGHSQWDLVNNTAWTQQMAPVLAVYDQRQLHTALTSRVDKFGRDTIVQWVVRLGLGNMELVKI